MVMEGKLIKHLWEWLGFAVVWTLYIDSSAAKSIIQRQGVDKVRHLDTRFGSRTSSKRTA